MEVSIVTAPQWTKPALIGAIVGTLATTIAGLSFGILVFGSKANVMANDRARDAVIAALTPICVFQSKADPNRSETMAKIKDAGGYSVGSMVIDAGWATMPGNDNPDRAVANACAEALSADL